MFRRSCFCLFLIIFPALANASLVGDTVTCAASQGCNVEEATIGEGWEFVVNLNSADILVDLDQNSMTLTSTGPMGLGRGWWLEIGDLVELPHQLVGIENFYSDVDKPDWADNGGIGLYNVSVRQHSVLINLQFSDWEVGDSVSFDLVTSATVVPIPAAAWLFGSALGILGWLRRKAV